MTAHRTTAVRRGEGFAAQCETCGSVTFGGFRTKAEARNALEHENAPETVAPVAEGESRSGCTRSQQAVPTPIKEQNAMPILSSPADTSNGLDLAALVATYPVHDPASTQELLFGVTDLETARRVCQQNVPAFSLPDRLPDVPGAISYGSVSWEGVDQYYLRRVVFSRPADPFTIDGWQTFLPDGTVTTDSLSVELVDDDLKPEGARAIAFALASWADSQDGPRSAIHVGPRPEPMGSQRRVVANIQRLRKSTGLSQNEFAIGAGYGPDEFSTFMTGRRHMDLEDVDRIARALGVEPLDLLAAEDKTAELDAGRWVGRNRTAKEA